MKVLILWPNGDWAEVTPDKIRKVIRESGHERKPALIRKTSPAYGLFLAVVATL
jgi:hypothetical protein